MSVVYEEYKQAKETDRNEWNPGETRIRFYTFVREPGTIRRKSVTLNYITKPNGPLNNCRVIVISLPWNVPFNRFNRPLYICSLIFDWKQDTFAESVYRESIERRCSSQNSFMKRRYCKYNFHFHSKATSTRFASIQNCSGTYFCVYLDVVTRST